MGPHRQPWHRRPVSLKMLAEHLDLSPATVSFVLNNAPNRSIPEATRERVRAAARQFNYQPSMVARLLQGKRSQTIGILLPELGEAERDLIADDGAVADAEGTVLDEDGGDGTTAAIELGFNDGTDGGTLGLGLHIARHAAEYVGAKLWAESTLGKGATFIVELPIEIPKAPPAA